MRKLKRLGTGLALVASAATLTALAAGPALADPQPAGTVPALTDIVGVGSDTTTPVFAGNQQTPDTSGALSLDYNASHPSPKLYSWDAVDPATGAAGGTIVTKGSGTTCSTARPNGSSAGITELKKNNMNGSSYCVDFARSSRPPSSTDGDSIAFAALAGDAITWATPSGANSPAPATLSLADLTNIYNCTYTNWDQIPGNSANNAPITAVLPQAGSGTRATFLLALGGGVNPLTPGSCVVNGTDSSGNPIEENTGVTAGDVSEYGTTTAPKVDTIAPYSIGAFIAQGPSANGVGGHATSIWAQGPMGLHSMTDDGGVVQAPTTTTNGQVVINQNFPFELQRTLYDVVRNAGTAANPAIPSGSLTSIFGPSGWACTNSTAQGDLVSYGFYSLGANCGSLTDSFLIYGT